MNNEKIWEQKNILGELIFKGTSVEKNALSIYLE
jgi:hypothetical protein